MQVKGFSKPFLGKCIFMEKAFPCALFSREKARKGAKNVNMQSVFSHAREPRDASTFLGFLKPKKDEKEKIRPESSLCCLEKLEIRAYYDETAPISKQALFRNKPYFETSPISKHRLFQQSRRQSTMMVYDYHRRVAGLLAGTRVAR